MKRPKTKKIFLEYPALRLSGGIKAEAVAIARVTPTLYVVERDHVEIIRSVGPTFGPPLLRFSRKTGEIVGRGNYRARWRVVTK